MFGVWGISILKFIEKMTLEMKSNSMTSGLSYPSFLSSALR
jgi:hypothetical protein